MNYYNENEPNAAAWLRELIKEKLIPAGDVDTRSITDVSPHELTGYTQQHFFAGIGGWSLALALALASNATCPDWKLSLSALLRCGKGLGRNRRETPLAGFP